MDMRDASAARAAARADLCRFLAALYYEPGPHLAEERVLESACGAASLLEPELAEGARRLALAHAAEEPARLLVDYTRLFLVPGEAAAHPYGSMWLGEAADSVLGLYEQGGMEPAGDFGDRPDHIAAELEFLYLMIFREGVQAQDGDEAARARDVARRLLETHLAAWVPRFARAVREAAQTGFYRELAGLTERFVALESQRMGIAAT